MDGNGWALVIAAIGTALGTVVGGLLTWYGKYRLDTQARRTTELERIVDRQENQIKDQDKRIALRDTAVTEVGQKLEKSFELHAECREETAELFGWLRSFREGWIYSNNQLKDKGGIPTPVPELPPRRHSNAEASIEYMRRSTQQTTALLQSDSVGGNEAK